MHITADYLDVGPLCHDLEEDPSCHGQMRGTCLEYYELEDQCDKFDITTD